jgi:hypothetical protein
LHSLQGRFPTLLELCGDEPILWITRGVTTLRERGLILGLLQIQLRHAPLLILALHVSALRLQCCLNRHWLDRTYQLPCNGRIDARGAKRHTPWKTQQLIGSVATIERARYSACVHNTQSTPAMTAQQDTRQQCASAPPGLDVAGLRIGVRGKELLVAFVFGPLDVPRVMILDHNLPLLERLAMSVAFANAPIDHGGSLLTFAIGVGAGIEGVLQQRDHIAVADGRPLKARQFFTVGGTRKVQLLGCQREQRLPCATQLAKTRKDQTDRFLQTHIRIKHGPALAVPEVTNGDVEAQFPAARLRLRRIDKPGAQNTEFKLAHRALQSK